jgi:nucleotide-binding universal stress UspA family protein
MSAPVKHLGIVVAVDDSPASNAATCWAAREAAMRNLPLTVVNVVATPSATYPPVPYPESLGVWLEDQGRKAVAHAVKIAEDAMPTDRKVAVGSEIVFSTPAPALVKMSDEAEMIVVGSSGKAVLARGLLGSISSSVVQHANCPVAVVRDDDGSAAGSRPAGNRRLAGL